MFSKFPLMPHKFYLTNQSMLLSLMRQFKSFISAHKKSTIVYQSLHFLHCIYHLVNVSLFFFNITQLAKLLTCYALEADSSNYSLPIVVQTNSVILSSWLK
jgi:hypothetical protein